MSDQPAAAPSLVQGMLIPLGFMFLIFYLIVFRPQQQSQRTHAAMLKNLKKHDEVVTTGGMFGTIVNIKPESVTLRVDDNVRIEVERSAIARLVSSPKTQGPEPPTAEKRS